MFTAGILANSNSNNGKLDNDIVALPEMVNICYVGSRWRIHLWWQYAMQAIVPINIIQNMKT